MPLIAIGVLWFCATGFGWLAAFQLHMGKMEFFLGDAAASSLLMFCIVLMFAIKN